MKVRMWQFDLSFTDIHMGPMCDVSALRPLTSSLIDRMAPPGHMLIILVSVDLVHPQWTHDAMMTQW